MKKKLLGLVLLTSTMMLGACSTNPGDRNENTDLAPIDVDWNKFKSASGTPTTVVFYSTIGTQNQPVMKSIIEQFESFYPGIQVQHEYVGGYDALFDKIKQDIAAGTQPTMAYCYSDHVATYLNSNFAVEDMTPYMLDPTEGFGKDDITLTIDGQEIVNSTAMDDLIPAYLEDGHNYVINGKKLSGYYSMPFTRSSEVLVYNKTAFDKWGIDASKLSTWKGVWEICQQIIDKTKEENRDDFTSAANLGTRAPLGYDSGDNLFITLSRQLGIPYTDGTYEIEGENYPLTFGLAGEGLEKGKQMLSKLREEYYNHYFMTQDTLSSYTSSAFANEQCYMTVSSTAGINYCVPDGTKSNFEVGVVGLPTSDDGNFVTGGDVYDGAQTNAVISQGPSVCFFSRATTDEKAAAWLFYKFASGSYMNAVWAGETGYEPVRNSSYNEEAFKAYSTIADTDSDVTKAKKTANNAVHAMVQSYNADNRLFASDVFVGSAESRVAVGNLLNGVLTDTTSGNASIPEKVLDELYKTATRTAATALPIN